MSITPRFGPTMEAALQLRDVTARAARALRTLSKDASAERPAPGKWSPRELVGHLVDSASNNHQRFVRAQLQDDLVFPGYDQDDWVATQHYQDAPWDELVTLFETFNYQIARVMEHAQEDQLTRSRTRHNLHQIAWEPVPENEPTTLGYFMRDYVGHLKHHLAALGLPGLRGLV